MIHQKTMTIGGKEFLHTYSDEFWIRQNETGIEYEDAMDLMPCPYTYSETERPLKQEEEPNEEKEQPEADNEVAGGGNNPDDGMLG